jgi:ABC-type glutathione transport system ATPase component
VTAGVVGSTGMGKSTLLNAIIGLRYILPTDDGRACTSVVIEVLWNPAEDPASIYKAKVIFLQESEWQSELEQLYQNIEERARNHLEDDDEADVSLHE